jgi:hypothetical protein
MTVPRLADLIGAICRVAVVGLVAFCVSGLPSGFLQGYAWLQMAREAGGIAALPRVILGVPPCGICEAAMRVADIEREGDGEKMPGGARVDLVLYRQASEEARVSWGVVEEVEEVFGVAGGLLGAGIGRPGPALPPPRGWRA